MVWFCVLNDTARRAAGYYLLLFVRCAVAMVSISIRMRRVLKGSARAGPDMHRSPLPQFLRTAVRTRC